MVAPDLQTRQHKAPLLAPKTQGYPIKRKPQPTQVAPLLQHTTTNEIEALLSKSKATSPTPTYSFSYLNLI